MDGHETFGRELCGIAGGLFGEEVVVGPVFAVLAVFNKGDVEAVEFFGNFVEMAAVGGVAVKIEFFVAVFDGEARPQGLVAVGQGSGGVVAGGQRGVADAVAFGMLPPVEFGDAFARHAPFFQQYAHAERDDEVAAL